MKKLLTLVLVIALAFSMGTVSAASEMTEDDVEQDVMGIYESGSEPVPVYSVDIQWGSLEFTYIDSSKGTWDPTNHQYNGGEAARWSCGEGENEITVTNHSNAPVMATLIYTNEQEYNNITGSFTESNGVMNDGILNLATAEETQLDSAPTDSATLILSGALSNETNNSTKIGYVTVTLN